MSLRSFSDEPLTIPTDKEQQGGRRKEELDAMERGEIAFDHRKSLVPPNDQGTKENPILVSNNCRLSSCLFLLMLNVDLNLTVYFSMRIVLLFTPAIIFFATLGAFRYGVSHGRI